VSVVCRDRAAERQRQQQRRDAAQHGTARRGAARHSAVRRGAARRVARQHNTLTWFETAPANPLDITCDSRGCLACRRRRRRRASNDGGGGGGDDRIGEDELGR